MSSTSLHRILRPSGCGIGRNHQPVALFLLTTTSRCVYTKNMASLQRKIIHGHPYYYLVQSRRLNGRPRPIVLAYLGSADTLLQRLQASSTSPLRARVTAFGGLAALYDPRPATPLGRTYRSACPQTPAGAFGRAIPSGRGPQPLPGAHQQTPHARLAPFYPFAPLARL